MKKTGNYRTIRVCLFTLVMSMFSACESKPEQLPSPKNVDISVTGRIVSVTWEEVKNVQGYSIVLTSEGCTSGNRTVDTKASTAVITGSGNNAANVEITGKTSLKVTLMAASGNPNAPMARAVTAKVMSLGGTNSKKEYINSDYTEETRIIIEK